MCLPVLSNFNMSDMILSRYSVWMVPRGSCVSVILCLIDWGQKTRKGSLQSVWAQAGPLILKNLSLLLCIRFCLAFLLPFHAHLWKNWMKEYQKATPQGGRIEHRWQQRWHKGTRFLVHPTEIHQSAVVVHSVSIYWPQFLHISVLYICLTFLKHLNEPLIIILISYLLGLLILQSHKVKLRNQDHFQLTSHRRCSTFPMFSGRPQTSFTFEMSVKEKKKPRINEMKSLDVVFKWFFADVLCVKCLFFLHASTVPSSGPPQALLTHTPIIKSPYRRSRTLLNFDFFRAENPASVTHMLLAAV